MDNEVIKTIEIIETTTKETPTHCVLNNAQPRNHKGYTTELEAEEEAIVEAIYWGKENVSVIEFKNLENPVLIDETVNGGGDSKANNIGKIL